MAYDYDKLYGETRDALGPPTQAFVDFFATYPKHNARVLDIGCGQGRDAVFIARLGHTVVGVDLSANGIRDLTAAATSENLPITGVVSDITTYTPKGRFNVIIIDRTLHMLDKASRLAVLNRLLDHVANGGWVLIADEKSNIPDFEIVIADHPVTWREDEKKGGTLFVQAP